MQKFLDNVIGLHFDKRLFCCGFPLENRMTEDLKACCQDRNIYSANHRVFLHSLMPEKSSGAWKLTFYIHRVEKSSVP
jgi:hypothetical protein